MEISGSVVGFQATRDECSRTFKGNQAGKGA